jgi:hypothetical protein
LNESEAQNLPPPALLIPNVTVRIATGGRTIKNRFETRPEIRHQRRVRRWPIIFRAWQKMGQQPRLTRNILNQNEVFGRRLLRLVNK